MACKQIHSEAFKMWFSVNEFSFFLIDLDDRHLFDIKVFANHCCVEPTIYVHVEHCTKLSALVEACERIYEFVPREPARFGLFTIMIQSEAAGAYRMMTRLPGKYGGDKSWEACLRDLDILRDLLGWYNSDWLADA